MVKNQQLKEVLCKQLGSKITNLHSIVKTCKYGYPVVIQSIPYKMEQNKALPFPTTFWLTCPYLRKRIGSLESNGYIKQSRELLKDKEVLQNFINARKKTVEIRLSMIEKNFKYYEHLRTLGIGGSKDDLKIKCLHLHVANYYGTKINPIGKWVLEQLGSEECSDCECCKFLNQ